MVAGRWDVGGLRKEPVTQIPPDAMVARLEQLVRELIAWGVEHRDASLAVMEEAVLAAVRQMVPGLVQDVLTLSCNAVRLPEARLGQLCPTCETRRSVDAGRPIIKQPAAR